MAGSGMRGVGGGYEIGWGAGPPVAPAARQFARSVGACWMCIVA